MRGVQISEDALEDLNNGYLFYEHRSPDSVSTLRLASGRHRKPENICRNPSFTAITIACSAGFFLMGSFIQSSRSVRWSGPLLI